MSATLAFVLCSLAAQSADPMGEGTQPGELTTPLANNASCQACHKSSDDPRMAASSYRGTMMDLAGVDPIFLAALEVASLDAPATAELCIKCHFPRAWLAGRTNGSAADGFGLEDNDLQGVQCDVCHRMAVPPPRDPSSSVPPPELSGVRVANAQIFLHDNSTKQGPFGSPFAATHGTAYSPLFEDSVLCAQCHDVSNTFLERIDDQGVGLQEPVPIERTYTEWKASAYSDPASADYKTCMSCHMAPYTGDAASFGSAPERELRSHRLVGGNTIAPRMVAHLYEGVSTPAFLANLGPDVEATVAAAKEQLQTAAELEALQLRETGEGHSLLVKLTNLTGHKLPTGYAEGRRMWIAHAVRFPDGQQGEKSGTLDGETFDFVPGEEPVRAYEVLLSEGLDPQHSFHFAKVNRLIKDNRIPPKGFVPTGDTPVLGHAYPEQPDGTLAHWDEIELPIGRNDDCWPAIVKVQLYFQASSGTYLRFLIDNAPVYGPDLADAFAAVGAPAEMMEELEVAVFPDGRIEPAAFHLCEPGPPPSERVDAGPDAPPPPPGDAGVGTPPLNDDDDAPACGCAATTSRATPAAGGLALLVCLARRRRQRIGTPGTY